MTQRSRMLRVDCHVWVEAEYDDSASTSYDIARTLAEGVAADCEVADSRVEVVEVSNTIVDGWEWGESGDPV